jgi:hypothetical protein
VHNGAGCISRGRADGEGHTVNVMQNNPSHQGLEICRGSTVSGQVRVGAARVQWQAG